MKQVIIESIQDLQNVLDVYAIDQSQWFKTKEKLFDEISNKEVTLVHKNERLVLEVIISRVVIYSPDKTQVLEEDYHIRNCDHRKITRTYSRRSVSEKIRQNQNEEPLEAARRGIQEELFCDAVNENQSGNFELHYVGNSCENHEDLYYLGLKFETTVHNYETVIPQEYYNPQGYVESQPSKLVYFHWFPNS